MNYDVIFLSYDEPNAEQNWQSLKSRIPYAKRIHGIKSIMRAHQLCAEAAATDMFFLVDGDNEVLADFSFNYQVAAGCENFIHVWRCLNPVNDLVYGYGAIKLYPRSVLVKMSIALDIATTVSAQYKIVPQVASVTRFNTNPFHSWKGGFRECVKLACNRLIKHNKLEQDQRLEAWCGCGMAKTFGSWCILGARMGRDFGRRYADDLDKLKLINNYDWLSELFAQVACDKQKYFVNFGAEN